MILTIFTGVSIGGNSFLSTFGEKAQTIHSFLEKDLTNLEVKVDTLSKDFKTLTAKVEEISFLNQNLLIENNKVLEKNIDLTERICATSRRQTK